MTDSGVLGTSSPYRKNLSDSRPLARLSPGNQCSQLLSNLHQSWRTMTSENIRENLVVLALIMSSTPVDEAPGKRDASSSTRKVVQKGFLRILQKHYASYKKGKNKAYDEFENKFDLLMDIMPQTFHLDGISKNENGALISTSTADNDDDEVQVLSHLLQNAIDRHLGLLLAVLKCFERMPLSCEAKVNVLQMSLARLSRVDTSQLPLTLAILGDLPMDDIESMQTIAAIRKLWIQLEERHSCDIVMLHFASKVVQWFVKEWNGHFLATAYLQSMEKSTENSSFDNNVIPVLDFIVLLSLSMDVEFGDQAKQILDSWVDLADYFAALNRTIRLLGLIENDQQEVVWELVDFSRELVYPIMDLALRRLPSTDREHSKKIHDFSMLLFDEFLSESDRSLFGNAIIQLWYKNFKEKREGGLLALYKVMRSLTNNGSGTMRHRRDLFVDVLQSRTTLNADVSRDICAILVPLYSAQEQGELLSLVDHLLLAPVISRCDGRMVNGVVLATEIVRQGQCEASAMIALKESVLRILLPSDRRMVSPELGSPGLAFLESCGGQSKVVFQDMQMILANTGLIQRLSAYQQSKRKYVPTLGYTKQEMKSETKDGDFIFCAAFFLRHVDFNNFDQWDSTVCWVFDLVNSYLANGRKRSKTSWNPSGWLQAVVEFPRLKFPFDVKGDQQKKSVRWILKDLGTFDIDKPGCTPPPANFRSICTDLLVRNPSGISLLYAALLRFSLGLLVGVSLSAATLKNAFEYYKDISNHTKKPALLQMIKGQVMKLYHLRDKIAALECALAPLEAALKKLESESNSQNNNQRVLSPENMKNLSSGIVQLRETLSDLCDRLFFTSQFIDAQILWECLTDPGDDELLKEYLNTLLSISSPSKRGASTQEIEATLNSKLRTASQLVCSSGFFLSMEQQDYVCRLASFTFFLVPLLPRLRGALSDMDSPPLNSWVRYSAIGIQLVTLCFMREAEPCPDPVLSVKGICLAMFQDAPRKELDMCDVVGELAQILSTADDVHVANGLMEMLSVLGSLFDGTLEAVSRASSKSLRKSLTSSGVTTSVSELPYSLMIISKALKAPTNYLPIIRKTLDATLCRTPKSRNGVADTFWVHRYSLLRHFALLVQTRSSEAGVEDFLENLLDQIESTLEWMDKQSRRKTRSRGKESSKRSPKRRISSFPSLTATTIAECFEASLHMSLGAALMYPPASSPAPEGGSVSPYMHFETFMHCFHRLAAVYVNYFCHFPRKTAGALYTSSKHVLDVVTVQISRCADWRSCYHLPKSDATNDPGSLVYFKQLIVSCRTLIVGGLEKIAKVWTEDKAAQVESKGRALEQGINRFNQTLDEISSSNGLSFDEKDEENLSAEWSTNKRQRVESPKANVQQQVNGDMEIDQVNEDDANNMDNMEAEDNEDGSFGAAGDWGGGACLDDDSVSSEEAITIHRTV